MISPLSAADLDANPAFAKTWQYITTEILERDASSKKTNEARRRYEGLNPLVISRADGNEEDSKEDGLEESLDDAEENTKKKKDLEEQLHAFRVKRFKMDILCEVLADLPYHFEVQGRSQSQDDNRGPEQSMPAEEMERDSSTHADADFKTQQQHHQSLPALRDLLLLIPAYLDATRTRTLDKIENFPPEPLVSGHSLSLGVEEQSLLSHDIEQFKTNIPTIAALMSSRFIELEKSLCAIARVAIEDGDEDVHKHLQPQPQSLTAILTPQISCLSNLRDTVLPSHLTQLTNTVQTLLTLQRVLLRVQIQHLEAHKHGAISRLNLARATFLSTVASTMDLKVRVMLLEARRDLESSAEAQERRAWIKRKTKTLEGEEEKLDGRKAELEVVLGEYETTDPTPELGMSVMRKLGTKYREVEGEMEAVKGDIRRLEARI
ncbi:uncharacterized protein Z518_06180 [Rhinocladiella mackenziei CBS 650.93]|uniref:Uncharacterized protein n=1 Tax=Rhinocladiella mackenziei CBS 650.93 TaxID=1442369 RepID=A0A0D2H4F8_9EURO|nr:uncharacterized protein Z518_06180 [Rhinocladiella mackenziei CBS 650.93]KIX05308.1 hypothetical protein Z518_06180 [Rhinocladiella mackenziei CBS 650.93]